VLKSGSADGDSAVRFKAEMAALALMDHPGIARVYRSGTTLEGQPFFAMEKIEGPPLNCYEGSLEKRLLLFQQVCDAVGHAHRRGVIHRDLKPSNVLIGIEDEETQAKVIDFGIAKATGSLLTKETLLTRAHQFLGTPAYMSPEQAEMRGEAVDTRSDIYSLGVLLYEMLTGSTPVALDGLEDVPYDEILRRIRTQEPRRPSQISADIDKDLDWIVLKALEKNPRDRYETADALKRDLQRFQEGRAIEARPPTTAYRVRKFVRRNRAMVAGIAGVLLAMVAGTVISSVMYLRAEESRHQAQVQAANARESDERGKRLFSHADFTQSGLQLKEQRPSLSVAHLARAVRNHPENRATAIKLLYTLASENWARPLCQVRMRGDVEFLKNGEQFVVTPFFPDDRRDGKYWLRFYDSLSGEKVREVPFTDSVTKVVPYRAGSKIAVSGWYGGIWVEEKEGSGFELLSNPKKPGRNGINNLRFSHDGKYLAASYWWSSRFCVWNCESKELVAEFDLRKSGRRGVLDFSPSGDSLVVAFGNTVKVCNLQTKEMGAAMSHQGEIYGVLFSSENRVVSWAQDGAAVVWDVTTGEKVMKLAHEAPVKVGVLHPDRDLFLTGTDPGVGNGAGFSRMWDLRTGDLVGAPVEYSDGVTTAVFSDDGRRAAIGCRIKDLGQEAVRVVDGESGELIMAPIFHPRGVMNLALSPDGGRVAITSRHHESAVWKIEEGKIRPLILRHRSSLWRASFEDDGKKIVTVSYGGMARQWDAYSGKRLTWGRRFGEVAVSGFRDEKDPVQNRYIRRRELDDRQWDRRYMKYYIPEDFKDGDPVTLASSRHGKYFVTGGKDGVVRVWSLLNGRLWKSFSHGAAVTSITLSDDSTRLASGGGDGSVVVWDLMQGVELKREKLHEKEVTVLALSMSGKIVASGSADGNARLWRPDHEDRMSDPLFNEQRVNHLAFSPDERKLASSGRANACFIWDVETGRQLVEPLRHIDVSTYGLFLLWSPDGQYLVTAGSHDNTARVWDAETGKMLAQPMEHPSAANAVSLSPDGRMLLFGDGSGGARIWDLQSGEALTPLLIHDGRVMGCTFDSDGRRFACSTLGGGVYLWDVPVLTRKLPDLFLDFAESLGGFRFNERGFLEQVPIEELSQNREKMRKLLSEGEFEESAQDWMTWLITDPGERSVSPGFGADDSIGDPVDRLIHSVEEKFR